MENREVKDIAIIANLLDGKVKFRKIEWSQILTGKHGESFNDLYFIGKSMECIFIQVEQV